MTQQTNGQTTSAPTEPEPTFDVLPLSPTVRRAVDEMGFKNPTPVQRAVFEPASKGGDLVVQARTGTGKTAAFGLPLVDRLVQSETKAVQALVLSPTRELALQITRQLESLGKYKNLSVVPIYGGAAMQPQVDALRQGAQLVAGTPGRVLDHLERGTLDPSTIKIIVLDESDEMLSMGFLPQITAILERLPAARQTLLFSATLPPGVRRIAESRLKNPEFITLSGDHIGALEIDHYVYTSRGDKAQELIRVLEIENPESAIVFCNTRDQTKRIATALQDRGYSADWLNADLAQNDRERVMASTREGKLRFLVCTDVAARGIDISHLTHVINADFPESTENYVHRTGRTGRAGRTGTAISLIAPQDVGNLYLLRLTYKIFPVERELPSPEELRSRREADLIAVIRERFPIRRLGTDELLLARRILVSEHAEQLLAGLLSEHLGKHTESDEEGANARRGRAPAPSARGDENLRHDEEKKRKKKDKEKDREKKKHRKEDEPRAQEPEEGEKSEAPRGKAKEAVSEKDPTYGLESVSATELLAASERKPVKEGKDVGDDDAVRIFVNLGKRDSVYREDFVEALEHHGFEADDVRFVKIRDTHTFVGVAPDLAERAVSALDGSTVGGLPARAEKARPKNKD